MTLNFCKPMPVKACSSWGLTLFLAFLCLAGVVAARKRATVYSADPAAIERARAFLSSPVVGGQVIEYVHFGNTYAGHEYRNTLPVHNAPGVRGHQDFSLQYTFRWNVSGVTDISFLCDETGTVYAVQVLSSNASSNLPFQNSKDTIEFFANDLLSGSAGSLDAADRSKLEELKEEDDASGMLAWHLSREQRSQLLTNR